MVTLDLLKKPCLIFFCKKMLGEKKGLIHRLSLDLSETLAVGTYPVFFNLYVRTQDADTVLTILRKA